MKLFIVSQKNPLLSIAEVNAYFPVLEVHGRFLIVEHAKKYNFLAYTKEVYSILFSCSVRQLFTILKKYKWNKIMHTSFCIRSKHNEKEIAQTIWLSLKSPKVDLENPDCLIHFFFIGNKVYCGMREWINPNTFFERKAHLRPEFYPA